MLSYLSGLSKLGFRYCLISLEQVEDLENDVLVQQMEGFLRTYGIDWIRLPYNRGGGRAVFANVCSMAQRAKALVEKESIVLVHSRSHVAATVGLYLKLRRGRPYLFDARGYWIDERVAEGRWFNNPWIYSMAKWLEKRIFRSSAAVVTLTGVMAGDLRSGALRRKPQIPVVVIPTCTDFDHFTPGASKMRAVSDELRIRLDTKLVIGMIGAVNASYCVREGLILFRLIKNLAPNAHLLCVTQQGDEAQTLIREAGIFDGDYTVVQSRYRDMPEWMSLMDWGLLLLNETFAKRGSMPTKLAEMLACCVRPIQYGCNQEVVAKVRALGSGIVLTNLSFDELARCAEQIAATRCDLEVVYRARDKAREEFGIEFGINKYDSLLTELLPNARR